MVLNVFMFQVNVFTINHFTYFIAKKKQEKREEEEDEYYLKFMQNYRIILKSQVSQLWTIWAQTGSTF